MINVVSFPEVRGLMAKYGLSQADMANAIGIYYSTFGNKLNGKVDFTLSEMHKIRAFLVSLGEIPEELTMESLFFAWKLHNSEEA